MCVACVFVLVSMYTCLFVVRIGCRRVLFIFVKRVCLLRVLVYVPSALLLAYMHVCFCCTV